MKKSLLIVVLLIALLFTAVVSADDLEKVKSSGVLRFGTSADYVPFVFWDGTTLDGMDIALIKEIGSRLGVEVKPIDMAFDGLPDALNIGQIDLVGGGYSITDSRKETMDFTSAYYKANAVVISLSGKTINESNIAEKKLGVQAGTTFDQWIHSNLLMGGYISPSNLFTYSKAEDAVSALDRGSIDLVMMDEDNFIKLYKSSGKYQVVSSDIADERYGFAALKGSTLIPEVNRILRGMIDDGTAQKIADKYFKMDFSGKIEASITRPEQVEAPEQVISRPTEEPAAPAQEIVQNTPNCWNGMQFVRDMSIPDGTTLGYDIDATKTWQIKNTGTCTWDASYTFNYVKGDLFGPGSVTINKIVRPGETYDVSVPFRTPSYSAMFYGYWQMRAGSGANFGQTIWLNFQTRSDGSNNQRVSTGTPKIYKWQPSIYKASDGTCPIVYWEVVDATRVEFYVNNQIMDRSDQLKGSMYICPPAKQGTYTYAILAIGESTLSTAFQFVNNKDYTNDRVQPGHQAVWPH